MGFIIRFANKIRAKLAIQDRINQILEHASEGLSSIVVSRVKPVESYLYQTYESFIFNHKALNDKDLNDKDLDIKDLLESLLNNRYSNAVSLIKSIKVVMPYWCVAMVIFSLPVFLLKIAYLDLAMLVNDIAQLGMSGLSIYGVYKGIQLYSIRFSCENKLLDSFYKLKGENHIEGMREIQNIFSSKLLTHKEKADLLMLKYSDDDIDSTNIWSGCYKDTFLRNIAKTQNSDFKRSVNCFLISLIQDYLSSEQVYTLLSEKEQYKSHTVGLNFFGTLIYEAQAEVMKDVLSISNLTSNQKFSLLMKASNNSGSGLFIASFLVSMIEQYTVTEIIAKNGDKIDQENYYKIVELLIDESKSFTNEQRLIFLTKPDCSGKTPLMCLEGVPKLKEKLLKAIQSCVPMLTYKQENSIPEFLTISPAVSSIDSSTGLLNKKKNRSAA